MSEASVDLIRHLYAEFARRKQPPWELYHPEAVFDSTDVMPDLDVIRGREAAGSAWASYVEPFEDFHIELKAIIAADDRHVVTSVVDGGRVKGSGALIHNRYQNAWTIERGKIVRWSTHLSPERALEAVGLSE
jgi:ketosteroid isomerase-like protein